MQKQKKDIFSWFKKRSSPKTDKNIDMATINDYGYYNPEMQRIQSTYNGLGMAIDPNKEVTKKISDALNGNIHINSWFDPTYNKICNDMKIEGTSITYWETPINILNLSLDPLVAKRLANAELQVEKNKKVVNLYQDAVEKLLDRVKVLEEAISVGVDR